MMTRMQHTHRMRSPQEMIYGTDPDSIDLSDFLPTDALPGSAEKIEVLRQRNELGLPLWHPNDRIYHLDFDVIDFSSGLDHRRSR